MTYTTLRQGLVVLVTSLAASSLLSFKANAETWEQQFESYLSATPSQSVSRLTYEDGSLGFASFFVQGVDECKASFALAIKSFAHQVVFGGLVGKEFDENLNSTDLVNPTIWVVDLERSRWDNACEAMRQVRETYVGCRITEDAYYPIGFYSLAYYTRTNDHSRAYELALKIQHRFRGMAIPLDEDCV